MSQRVILIDYPGDGDWIMDRAGGSFNERVDHTIAVHRDGVLVGGVVFTGYLRSAIVVHMAGIEDGWATRDFLWMVFHYAFVQQGVRKLLGFVSSSNLRALSIDRRLGFREVARVTDVLPDGSDLIILAMTKNQCRWLALVPRHYKEGVA